MALALPPRDEIRALLLRRLPDAALRIARTFAEALRKNLGDLTRPGSDVVLEGIRRDQLRALGVVGLLVLGFGGWAATSDLTGAVIASGKVVVDGEVRKVQHPWGGRVDRIFVHDGMSVAAGAPLARLNDTVDLANRDLLAKQIDEAEGRRARLEAERDGRAAIDFPASLLDRRTDPQVAHIVGGETTLFESRRAGRDGQKAQLRERITQLGEEIAGLEGQTAAKKRELGYIALEKKGVEDLVVKKLVPITRLNALQRDEARLVGETDQLRAGIAQARGKIAEIELQIGQLDQDTRTEALRDLREVQGRIGELSERRIAAEDRLAMVEIRAPTAGIVHAMTIHTVNGVIAAGEVVAEIVPVDDALAVEARIAPNEIDQVAIGQTAFLRLTAFNQRTTPELEGVVARVGASLSQDREGGPQYYAVRISIPDAELHRLGGLRLVPGMPVETHMRTEARTALSFLLRPLFDSMHRAGRER